MAVFDLFFAVTRLALIATVLSSTFASLQSTLLAATSLLLAWGVIVPRALDDLPNRGCSSDTEQMLVVATSLRTLLILDRDGVPSGDYAWLTVVILAVVYTYLAGGDEMLKPPAKRHWAMRLLELALLGSIVGAEMQQARLSEMRTVLLVGEALIGSALLALPASAQLALYLQATALLVATDSTVLAVRIGVLVALFVVTASRGEGSLLSRVQDAVSKLLTATLAYQMVVLTSFLVLLQSLAQPWFVTRVTFPSLIRKQCSLLLDVVDIVKFGYEFTSEATFQRTLLPVLPEIGQVRQLIHRSLFLTYKPLTHCVNGKTATFTPSDNMVSMVFFVPIAITAMAVLLQIFPKGGSYVRSPVFWAVAMVGGLAFTVVTQLTADAPVRLWFLLFDGSEIERVYTEAGTYALVASIAFTAACLLLSLTTAWANRPPSASGNYLKPLVRLVDYATSPPVLVLAGAGLVMVVAVSSGFPVSDFRIYKVPTGAPEWLVSTPVDKAAALGAETIVSLMAKNGGRIYYIGLALTTYAVGKLGTWGCLCLDDIIGAFKKVGGFFEDLGSALKFWRRRLLEHKVDSTSYGRHSVARRRLLGSCSTIKVCVSDVVKTIIEELTDIAKKGFEIAVNVAAKVVRELIPFADQLDSVLDKIKELDNLVDFDLLTLPSANLGLSSRVLGLDLFSLGTFRSPSLQPPTWGLALGFLLLVASGLLLAYLLGLLEPLLVSTWLSIELLVLGVVVASVCSVLVFVYSLQSQLRAEGYEVSMKLNANAYVYGISLLMGVASLLLAASSSALTVSVATMKAVDAERRPLVTPGAGGRQ